MGAGIAQVCAQAGCRVFLTDTDAGALEKAVAGIQWSVEKLAGKGMVTEAPETVLGRISPEQGLQRAAEADWVIEAVLEKEDLKKEIFAELDRLAPAGAPRPGPFAGPFRCPLFGRLFCPFRCRLVLSL